MVLVGEGIRTHPADAVRARICVRGIVQGVGFRPFVFRIAAAHGLSGWVRNDPDGVWIEAEAPAPRLRAFMRDLREEAPALAKIDDVSFDQIPPEGSKRFEILQSRAGDATTLILPDVATCPLCLADISAPGNRRFRYPFTNCTNCGPRYTIIESLPWDRPSTSMKHFPMCGECRTEYDDPYDRRFHAQPNACPSCGPQLALWDADGTELATRHDALLQAAEVVRLGGILAVKGLGGFHLFADARRDETVAQLREAKVREEKPFAIMVPSISAAGQICHLTSLEKRLLTSPEAPIVLLRRRRAGGAVSDRVAPGNPRLGVMLPYTPLHHLLMSEVQGAVVATSGNRKDEPIATDEREALERLRGIADFFLVHDRPIVRHVDDSVVMVVDGRELVLRRSRGYAPRPVSNGTATPLLAVGAHQKNAVAISFAGKIFLSQHIGDLETPEAVDAFHATTRSLQSLYRQKPVALARDAHPNYGSTIESRRLGLPAIEVQHHHAHVVSCMAEHDLDGTVLGIAFDGSGWGPDGTVWGGEILRATRLDFERFARLRTFALPGGERAVREPRRAALGVLFEMKGAAAFDHPAIAAAFSSEELSALRRVVPNPGLSPRTSSAGRLFDAVAFLTGLRPKCSFEGQAAMELEWSIDPAETAIDPWAFEIEAGDPAVLDWAPIVEAVLRGRANGESVSALSSRFHSTLAAAITALAVRAGEPRVVLTGGCFQNRVLTERTAARLRAAGLEVFTHGAVPPNDGGIAVGQLVVAARRIEGGRA
ncbi:MAG: carbamoyltransferase HypF [Thermoanaerobaculia bacterium]